MNWRVNAFCPQGHLNTLEITFPDDVTGPTAMAFWAPEECETCTSLADLETRKREKHEKRELRRFRRELKRLG